MLMAGYVCLSVQDIGLPAGTYAYGIADYGNIIAIAPDAHHVQSIWYVLYIFPYLVCLVYIPLFGMSCI